MTFGTAGDSAYSFDEDAVAVAMAEVYVADLAAVAAATAAAAIFISCMIGRRFIAYQACASGPMVGVSVVKIFAFSTILVTASCEASLKALIMVALTSAFVFFSSSFYSVVSNMSAHLTSSLGLCSLLLEEVWTNILWSSSSTATDDAAMADAAFFVALAFLLPSSRPAGRLRCRQRRVLHHHPRPPVLH
jgi:hypothetical protein